MTIKKYLAAGALIASAVLGTAPAQAQYYYGNGSYNYRVTPQYGGGFRLRDSYGNSSTYTPQYGGGYRYRNSWGGGGSITPQYGGGYRVRGYY